jgi:hypothetical protein
MIKVVLLYTAITVATLCVRAAVVTDRFVAGITNYVIAAGGFSQWDESYFLIQRFREHGSRKYGKLSFKLCFVADFTLHEVISCTWLFGLGVKWMSRSIFKPNGPVTD